MQGREERKVASTRTVLGNAAILLLAIFAFTAGWLVAKTGVGAAIDSSRLPEIERQFTETLRGAALVGRFTVQGRDDRSAAPDRYDVYSVDKVAEDQWRFNAKIGETGVTLPIVIRMKFVDDTPIILMTDATIPAMGTFTARVFFYGDLYAGTWSHGERRGHLFGRIERGGAQK